ncbi:glycoside hydrolase family 98 domain-containing protein [Arcanobacterium hippocoleae]
MRTKMRGCISSLLTAALALGFGIQLQQPAYADETPAGYRNVALNAAVTGTSPNSDTSAESVTNGKTDSLAASEYFEIGTEAASSEHPQYVQVNLAAAANIDKIKMWRYYQDRRQYKNTVILVSEDDKFDKSDVVYNADGDDLFGFGSGSEKYYDETNAGHEFKFNARKARYIRVYNNGNSKYSNGGHYVEIEAWGTLEQEPAETPAAMPHSSTTLEIPTFEADGKLPNSATHPDILKFAEPWAGYEYWMILTPNQTGNSQYENPSLAASHDGKTWKVPEGITNPITGPKEEPKPTYNCDTDLVYAEEEDALYVYYVWTDDDKKSPGDPGFTPSEVRLIKITHEGNKLNVGKIQTLFKTEYHFDLFSPAVVRNGDKWLMYSVDTQDGGWNNQNNFVELRTSSDGIHWSNAVSLQNTFDQPGYQPWHIDVKYIPEKSEYWAFYPAYKDGTGSNATSFFFAKSKDGLHWQTYEKPVLEPKAGTWYDKFIYRSTFLYDAASDKISLWYSAGEKDNRWGIAYTENTYTNMEKALGNIAFAKPDAEISMPAAPKPGAEPEQSERMNLALNKPVTGVAANNQTAPSSVTDGVFDFADKNPTPNDYYEIGAGKDQTKTDPYYVQVDLGAVGTIDEVDLWRYYNPSDHRTYHDTIIFISEDKGGFFKAENVIYNSDESNFFGLGKGTAKEYQESVAGLKVKLEAPKKGRYITVVNNGHTMYDGKGGHYVEIQAWGTVPKAAEEEPKPVPAKRITVDNEHPLLIIPVYVEHYSAAETKMDWENTLEGMWNNVPDDVKPYALMEIHCGSKFGTASGWQGNKPEELKDFYEQQLKIADEKNIPVTIVVGTSGNQPQWSATGTLTNEWLTDVAQKHDSLKAFLITENYWTTYMNVANRAADILRIAHENGLHLIWSEHKAAVMEEILRLPAFKASLDKYGESMIFTWKNTPREDTGKTASYFQGLWLNNNIAAWGGLSDTWVWFEKSFWKPFAGVNQLVRHMNRGEECRAVVSEPEALIGIQMLSIYNNGGVVYNFEHPAYVYAAKDQPTHVFNNEVLEVFRHAIKHPAPAKEALLEKTKAVVHGDISRIPLHHGLNMDDESLFTYSTGRYGLIPAVPQNFVLRNPVKAKELPVSEITDNSARIQKFNELYPETYTGNAYAEKVNNTWVLYNSIVNGDAASNKPQNAKIDAGGIMVDVTMQPHTFTYLDKIDGGIEVYLNNYRADKSEIWENYGPDVQPWNSDTDTKMDDWLANKYIPNPQDDVMRDTVYVLENITEKPEVKIVSGLKNQYKEPTVAFDAAAKRATVTIPANGYVTFQILADVSSTAWEKFLHLAVP